MDHFKLLKPDLIFDGKNCKADSIAVLKPTTHPRASHRFSEIPKTSVAAMRHNTTRNPRDALRVRVSLCVTPRSVGRGQKHPGWKMSKMGLVWLVSFFGGKVFLEARKKI